MKNTVAIVGSHPRTRTEFDFSRTDCDIWVFNEALSNPTETWCPRADAVFQMHVDTIWKNPNNRNDKNHAAWLTTQTETAVYMQDKYPDVPMAIKYPVDEVCNGLNFNKRYFTSSVAYAIALAAHLQYPNIEIYGVEMETDTEYRYQRDGVTFWIGVAVGKGLKVDAYCSLFDAPLYGYEGDIKMPYEVFTEGIKTAEEALPELQSKYEEKRTNTAQAVQNFIETGKGGQAVIQSVQEQLGIGIKYGTLDGMRQECERYKKKADAMIQTTGEFVFSRQEFDQARQALQKKQMELMTRTNVLAGQTEAAFKQIEKVKNLNRRRKRMNDFVSILDEYVKATVTTAMIVGGLEQNQKFIIKLDEYIRAAGGSKSEAVLLEAHANRS